MRESSRLQAIVQIMRLRAPVGTYLVFLPCLWGLVAGHRGAPPLKPVLLFFLGALLMRSAGCIYNDWVDRDLDCDVARTASRPLAAGTLALWEAWGLLGILLLLSFILLLQFDARTIGVSIGSLGLVALYPWAKRFTFWPQFLLGLAFNWGVWVGWSASGAPFTWKPLLLYSVGVLWTLAYDTLYAYQDYQDDLRVGIRSSAIYLQHRGVWFVRACWAGMLVLLILWGVLDALNPLYFVGLGVVVLQFLWQDRQIDLENPDRCGKIFRANPWVGLMIFLSLLAGY